MTTPHESRPGITPAEQDALRCRCGEITSDGQACAECEAEHAEWRREDYFDRVAKDALDERREDSRG